MLVTPRKRIKTAAFVLALTAVPAFAESPGQAPQDPAGSEAAPIALPTIEVMSQELEAARLQIQPSLGASTYYFGPEALETIPQGENSPLNQVLLQMPAVAQDSFGQIHVRGDHANVQFRINGVQLPEGLSVFGQALETRFARSVSLLTGALPAQYGFFTAGVLDIQTKTGLTNPGLAITMYGGSFNWLEPSFEYGGHEGPVDWFFTGDHLSNERGIENPAATYDAIHDATEQIHGFAYMSDIIDPNTRVSLLGGAFDGRFEIPNRPGQIPSLGLNVLGASSFDSKLLNEVQHESNQFGVLSLQKHVDDFDMQISAFVRNSVLSFSPDVIGDLLFNGVTPFARKSDLAEGVQMDASYRLNDSHTLRGGFLAQIETT
ncbi:MAG: ligand-gated channel, partial [Methylocapsa sp.]|nr:ligand-gated channel [Methylocapsa sp.]